MIKKNELPEGGGRSEVESLYFIVGMHCVQGFLLIMPETQRLVEHLKQPLNTTKNQRQKYIEMKND